MVVSCRYRINSLWHRSVYQIFGVSDATLIKGGLGFMFLKKEIIFTRVIKGPRFKIPPCSGSITNHRQASKTCKALKCENTFSHAGLRTKQNIEETLCAWDHTFDMLLKRFSGVFHMYIKFTSKRRGHALSCTFCRCLEWICGSLSRTSLWILRNSLWWASGLVPEQGGLRFHSSRGTHKFSCFPCSWCDQKHISLIHYRAQNLTPFLILLMW